MQKRIESEQRVSLGDIFDRVSSLSLLLFFLKFCLLMSVYFRDRETEHKWGERHTEPETESEAGSRL